MSPLRGTGAATPEVTTVFVGVCQFANADRDAHTIIGTPSGPPIETAAPTEIPIEESCPCDCDGSNGVDELIRGVNIAHGLRPPTPTGMKEV